MVFYLGTAAIALLFSAIFHMFYPMNEWTYNLVSRFDYAGITILSMGSVCSPQYYGFYCQPDVATLYLFSTFVLSVACCIVLLFEWIHRSGHETYKATLYTIFAFSISVPTFHLWFNELLSSEDSDPFSILPSIPYYLLSGMTMILSLYIYTARCP